MNASEQCSHCQDCAGNCGKRAFDHERRLNEQVRGADVTHNLCFRLATHCRQADRGRNQQDGGNNHDATQAEGHQARSVNDVEQRLDDFALVFHLGNTGSTGEFFLDDRILLGVNELHAEGNGHHVYRCPFADRGITVELQVVFVRFFLGFFVDVLHVLRHFRGIELVTNGADLSLGRFRCVTGRRCIVCGAHVDRDLNLVVPLRFHLHDLHLR